MKHSKPVNTQLIQVCRLNDSPSPSPEPNQQREGRCLSPERLRGRPLMPFQPHRNDNFNAVPESKLNDMMKNNQNPFTLATPNLSSLLE